MDAAPDATPPLAAAARTRGRRLAIASHPFGMTFQLVFTQPLPTLALLALGASESLVGLQNALVQACLLLQLPTLRSVGRRSKRGILVGAHAVAVLAALPLLAFRPLAAAPGGEGLAVALAAFAVVAAAVSVSNTVWFPLLRGYVEPVSTGRFFGILRTGWHLALIGYFLASQAWLARHPGDFAPLFAAAWLCGLVRVALIARLPERDERTGARIHMREALALLSQPRMRRYLGGVAWSAGARLATLPFVITLMRRELGMSDAQVLATTVATFAGGLVSLYLWGRAVDRVGAAPIFRACALGMGALVAAIALLDRDASTIHAAFVAFFFLHSTLASGFGVADTRVLFELAPEHAPSRALVLASVSVGTLAGVTPALAGIALEAALGSASDGLAVYRGFFLVLGALQALAFLPLRGFGRGG